MIKVILHIVYTILNGKKYTIYSSFLTDRIYFCTTTVNMNRWIVQSERRIKIKFTYTNTQKQIHTNQLQNHALVVVFYSNWMKWPFQLIVVYKLWCIWSCTCACEFCVAFANTNVNYALIRHVFFFAFVMPIAIVDRQRVFEWYVWLLVWISQ